MANFNGLILTQAGANLQDKIAVSGATLQFTRAAIGDGVWPAGLDPTSLTGLVSEKKSLAIQGLTDEGTGQHKISVLVDNTGLAVGFMTREIGVFADDPDLGEILYQVTSADSPDYLPPGGGATHIEMALDLIVVTSSASSVTAVINEGLVYARKEDVTAARDSFKGFELNGRHTAYTGDLDVIGRNSLYAVQQGVALHLPEYLEVGAWAFVQTMILPGDAGRTQLVWSVDDPDRSGWWRRRSAGVWSEWRFVGLNEASLVARTRDMWAGVIVAWEAASIPVLDDGKPLGLELDGAIVDLAEYPRLLRKWCGGTTNATARAWYKCTSNGTRDTAGTYIKLQDRRGEFVRGWDHGRGIDAGRGLGSWSSQEMPAHNHQWHVPGGGSTAIDLTGGWTGCSYNSAGNLMGISGDPLQLACYTSLALINSGNVLPRSVAAMYIVLV